MKIVSANCSYTFTAPDPRPKLSDVPSPLPNSNDEATLARGVVLADANIGQLNVGQKNQLMSATKPQNVAGLFPEDTKRVRACTVRVLPIPLIDEEGAPIAAKQQRFSPEQADAIQREVKNLAEWGSIRKSTPAWAARCVTVRKKDGTLRLCQDYRPRNSCMKTDSGGLGDTHAFPAVGR